MSKGLNLRQQRFVEAYTGPHLGNATASAEAAGYSPKAAPQQGHVLLRNPKVRRAIEAINARVTSKHIKTMTELKEYWSAMVDGRHPSGAKVPLGEGVACSKLLATSHGGLTQKLKVEGTFTLLDLVNESMGKPVAATPAPAPLPPEEPET